MQRNRRRLDAAEIAHVAAAVLRRIAVQSFLPKAAARRADPVTVARHRGEITNDENNRRGRFALADQTDCAGIRVVANVSFDTSGIAVLFLDCRLVFVKMIERAHPFLQTGVQPLIEQLPLQARVMRPFAPLAEFAAHEQQFF